MLPQRNIVREFRVRAASETRMQYGKNASTNAASRSHWQRSVANNTLEPILIEQSEITCPQCGHREVETMPTNACQFFYDCRGCGDLLKPLSGDCCVFCSYGTVKCPPIQAGDDCRRD